MNNLIANICPRRRIRKSEAVVKDAPKKNEWLLHKQLKKYSFLTTIYTALIGGPFVMISKR